ncbi:MAG: hypothetical protein KIT58_03940, partial [Planctomycetota bacterium]|nr:hypothetical protein [Planctomycetota bacterium]
MVTSGRARAALRPILPSLVLLVAGCGGTEEKGDPAPTPRVAAPAPRLLASYAGTWTRDDGVVYEVQDADGAVRGALQADPAGRWRSVEFTLRREQETLRGAATVARALEDEDDGAGRPVEGRWELVPVADGGLRGRLQT